MENTTTKRPQLLSAFCLLSFIGSSIAMLLHLSIIIFHTFFLNIARQYAFQYGEISFSYMNATIYFMIYAISFLGVIGLWYMRRIGYWVYVSAQVLILLLQLISPTGISLTNFCATAVFIAGYTYFYKTLH